MPGKRMNRDGYALVIDYDHPSSYSNGTVLEHRLIWEKYHNARLLKWGTIHHINGIRTDNRIENLFGIINNTHVHNHMKEKFKNHISVGLKRKCSECGVTKVYFDVKRRYYVWKKNPLNKKLLCNNCYQKVKRRMKRIPR